MNRTSRVTAMIREAVMSSNVLGAILIIGFLCAIRGGLVGVLGVLLGMLVSGAIVAIRPPEADEMPSWLSLPPLR